MRLTKRSGCEKGGQAQSRLGAARLAGQVLSAWLDRDVWVQAGGSVCARTRAACRQHSARTHRGPHGGCGQAQADTRACALMHHHTGARMHSRTVTQACVTTRMHTPIFRRLLVSPEGPPGCSQEERPCQAAWQWQRHQHQQRRQRQRGAREWALRG